MAFYTVVFATALMLCAVSAVPRPGRIINGIDTTTDEHLHQITLQQKTYNGWMHVCGGSVIAENWVVTAAHCVVGQTKDVFHIVVNEGVEHWEKIYFLDKIIMHPEFVDGYSPIGFLPNDIALIKTSKPIEYAAEYYIIGLPPDDHDFVNDNCTITGWGYIKFENGEFKSGQVLQETWGHILSKTDCISHKSRNYNHIHNLCIHNDVTGACMGDSGGPMVCKGVLAGVTSFGHAGCDTQYPAVYTRVSNYIDWLHNTMSSNT